MRIVYTLFRVLASPSHQRYNIPAIYKKRLPGKMAIMIGISFPRFRRGLIDVHIYPLSNGGNHEKNIPDHIHQRGDLL